jgi:hypothetical protein
LCLGFKPWLFFLALSVGKETAFSLPSECSIQNIASRCLTAVGCGEQGNYLCTRLYCYFDAPLATLGSSFGNSLQQARQVVSEVELS